MQQYFLLPAYVVAETGRAILSFVAGRSGVHISTTLVAFSSEALKLTIALVFLNNWIDKEPRYKQTYSRLEAFKHALFTGGKTDVDSSSIGWNNASLPLAYAIPACLYLVNNLLYLIGVQITTVSLLHAIMFAKLPFTAVLHHLLVRRQASFRVWASLLVICGGLAVYAFPSPSQNSTTKFRQSSASVFGPAIGLIIAVVSGFASIYTELLMKADVAFWVAQVWLYFWGTAIATVVGLVWDGQVHSGDHVRTVIHTSRASTSSPNEVASYHTLVIVATALVGLITANILRKKDNLVKLVGTSVCVVTILGAQVLLFPELRSKSLSPLILIGLGLITVGAWVYNYLISQGSSSSSSSAIALYDSKDFRQQTEFHFLPQYDDVEIPDLEGMSEARSDSFPSPMTIRLGGSMEVFRGSMDGGHRRQSSAGLVSQGHSKRQGSNSATYAVPVQLQEESKVDLLDRREARTSLEFTMVPSAEAASPGLAAWTVPNRGRVLIVLSAWLLLAAIVWQAKKVSLPYTTYLDTARFFDPLKVTRSEWGRDRESHDPDCIMKWIGNEHLTPKSHALDRIEKNFGTNGSCPVYPIPDGGLNFHIFYSGPFRPFHKVAIDAFLATQRLQDGHRLLYWLGSREDGTWDETIEYYKKSEYAKFVRFMAFDQVDEARGTCFETMPEYNNAEHRKSVNMPVVSWSDLVRILLLTKYGGVWLDADSLLLRDMTPYIRMGPSVPSIIGTDRYNNNLLVAGPSGTSIGQTLMSTACSIPYNGNELAKVYPEVKPDPWYWLYKDGLFEICEKHTQCGFTRLPLGWSAAWWAPSGSQDELKPCDDVWGPDKPAPATLHGVFAWQARLNQFPNECVTDESKPNAAQVFIRRVREALEDGLEMEGRSLFPGPGYGR